jgi:hypothetical protein
LRRRPTDRISSHATAEVHWETAGALRFARNAFFKRYSSDCVFAVTFPPACVSSRLLSKPFCKPRHLRTGEANLDTSRCADEGHGDSLHHPRWRHYLLCPFAQRFFKGIPRVLDMYIWRATWFLRWVDRTNSSAPLVRVGKQMVLTAGCWKARLESPPQNLGTPSLRRRRVRARKLGMRDPTIQTPGWYMPRRR